MIRSFSADNDTLTVSLTVTNPSEAFRILALISSAVGVDVAGAFASAPASSPTVNIAMAASSTPPQLAVGPKRSRTPTANVTEPAAPAGAPTQPVVLPPPPPPPTTTTTSAVTQPAAPTPPPAAVAQPAPTPPVQSAPTPPPAAVAQPAVSQPATTSPAVPTAIGDIPAELTLATCTLREVLIYLMRKGIRTADAVYAHCLAMEQQVPCISRLKANLQERIERMLLLVTEADLAPK